MAENETNNEHAELHVTTEEAHRAASLLRYAVGLNTTVGLVSPTERRLATSTYLAAELAAQILEGKTFAAAARESLKVWTGSLEKDYQHALDLVQSSQEATKQLMSQYMQPEQFSRFLEVSQDQFLELLKSSMPGPPSVEKTKE